MARPTKYNQEVADKLILFIEQGLTVKDACYGVNISPDTCSRWRQRYPEFAEKFMEASKRQLWGSADALAKYHHYRPYRRKVGVCLPSRQRPLEKPLRSSQRVFEATVRPRTWHSLPLADMYEPVKKSNQYYYDQKRNRVFRKVGGVLQNMSGEVWERKHLCQYDEPFFGMVI